MDRKIALVDVMDTLVRDPFFTGFPRFHGLSTEALLDAKDPAAWGRFERGEIDENTYVRTAFKDGRWFDVQALRQMLVKEYAWLDGMEPLLASMKARGVEVYALSNYPVWYQLIEDKLQLSRYLSWRFVSCRTGFRKPSVEAYQAPLLQLAVDPAQCIFIDDRTSNCEAAESLGIRSHRFTSVGACTAFLQRMDFL